MKDDSDAQVELMKTKLRELEARLKLLESETRGGPIDFSQIAKPDLLKDEDEQNL
jgi:hypothetical protein